MRIRDRWACRRSSVIGSVVPYRTVPIFLLTKQSKVSSFHQPKAVFANAPHANITPVECVRVGVVEGRGVV